MTEVVNLNKFRKNQSRERKRQQAEQNRTLHGRTKGEKQKDKADKSSQISKLDGHELDKPENWKTLIKPK